MPGRTYSRLPSPLLKKLRTELPSLSSSASAYRRRVTFLFEDALKGCVRASIPSTGDTSDTFPLEQETGPVDRLSQSSKPYEQGMSLLKVVFDKPRDELVAFINRHRYLCRLLHHFLKAMSSIEPVQTEVVG